MTDPLRKKEFPTMDGLPHDILNLISEKLTFDPDYVRFRSVCKSWRIAAPKRTPIPWILGVAESKFHNILFFKPSFENHTIKQILKVKIGGGNKCIGSSHGWLALMDPSTSKMALTNPITLSTIPLPSIPFCANDDCIQEENILCITHNDDLEVVNDVVPHPFYSNFLLSSDPGDSASQCLVMIVCYYHFSLSYCKIGDVCWSLLDLKETISKGICCGTHIHSCFYKEKLYLANGSDVYVCTLGSNPSITSIATVWQDSEFDFFDELHLVESDGDLLLVVIPQRFHQEFELAVYMILETEDERVGLAMLKSLGNRALFMSRTTCLSIPACRIPGCKENSVYYPWGYKVRVFNFGGESHELIEDELNEALRSSIHWRMYAWFTPRLL